MSNFIKPGLRAMQAENKPILLIVDDTPANIQVLADAFRRDYRIKVASHGVEALEVLGRGELPDLILLDVMMPGMDGYEVCRRLKQDQRTHDIPVIFVTARHDVADEELGLNLGAVDYITKPYHLPIVQARVRTHVELKRKTDLLESLAMIDGLTGIANRRSFDRTLDSEWRRAKRQSTPLSLIMMDIDYFKPYNDHYGHGAGDLCLRWVAKVLGGVLARSGDLVARYGGEEFVAILPATAGGEARILAERMRETVAGLGISHQHSAVADHVTLSVGAATVRSAAGYRREQLLELADAMLYKAKAAGRNRVRHGCLDDIAPDAEV